MCGLYGRSEAAVPEADSGPLRSLKQVVPELTLNWIFLRAHQEDGSRRQALPVEQELHSHLPHEVRPLGRPGEPRRAGEAGARGGGGCSFSTRHSPFLFCSTLASHSSVLWGWFSGLLAEVLSECNLARSFRT